MNPEHKRIVELAAGWEGSAATVTVSPADATLLASVGCPTTPGKRQGDPAAVAAAAQGLGGWPDPRQPRRRHRMCEVGALRQEAVAGMHGLGAGALAGIDDLVGDEIGLAGGGGAEQYGLVGEADVAGIGIGFGVHGDGVNEAKVGVESAPGQGSRFWMQLRLAHVLRSEPGEPGVSQEVTESLIAQRHTGKRILLVEDDPINQQVAAELLAMADLRVDVAGNGEVALQCVQEKRYDLILMDVQMPVMGGLEATRAIRELPGMAEIPILAMTANAFEEDRQSCLAAGMNDHIGKPVDPDILFETLLRWLGARSQ